MCKFKSIHFETAFVYISLAWQKFLVVSVCWFKVSHNLVNFCWIHSNFLRQFHLWIWKYTLWNMEPFHKKTIIFLFILHHFHLVSKNVYKMLNNFIFIFYVLSLTYFESSSFSKHQTETTINFCGTKLK